MSNIWLISDTHFGHTGVCRFMRADGVTKLRPWDDPEEMNEALIDNWNRVVGKNDRVYHLGDVVIARRQLNLVLPRLNGRKVLIKGNHDIFPLKDYLPHFDDIRGSHKLDNFVLTHIPVHADSLARWCDGNIHGHLHSNYVMREVRCQEYAPPPYDPRPFDVVRSMIDDRYINVCVENIDYTPINFEEIKARRSK